MIRIDGSTAERKLSVSATVREERAHAKAFSAGFSRDIVGESEGVGTTPRIGAGALRAEPAILPTRQTGPVAPGFDLSHCVMVATGKRGPQAPFNRDNRI